jgi:hypothetical protein
MKANDYDPLMDSEDFEFDNTKVPPFGESNIEFTNDSIYDSALDDVDINMDGDDIYEDDDDFGVLDGQDYVKFDDDEDDWDGFNDGAPEPDPDYDDNIGLSGIEAHSQEDDIESSFPELFESKKIREGLKAALEKAVSNEPVDRSEFRQVANYINEMWDMVENEDEKVWDRFIRFLDNSFDEDTTDILDGRPSDDYLHYHSNGRPDGGKVRKFLTEWDTIQDQLDEWLKGNLGKTPLHESKLREGGHRRHITQELRDKFIHNVLIIPDPADRQSEIDAIFEEIRTKNTETYYKQHPELKPAEQPEGVEAGGKVTEAMIQNLASGLTTASSRVPKRTPYTPPAKAAAAAPVDNPNRAPPPQFGGRKMHHGLKENKSFEQILREAKTK